MTARSPKVLQPRNRLLYFRVSQEELETYHRMCSSQGARNLSELARKALHRLAEPPSGAEDALRDKLERVDRMLGELDHKLQRLERLLDPVCGLRPESPAGSIAEERE